MEKRPKAAAVIISSLLLIAIAAAIGYFAFAVKSSVDHRFDACIEHTDAKVVSVEEAGIVKRAVAVLTGLKPSDNEGFTLYEYTVSYKVKDKKYSITELAIPEQSLNKGDKVSVSYDPADPSSAYLYMPEAKMKLLPVFIACAVFGVLAILRFFSLKKIIRGIS